MIRALRRTRVVSILTLLLLVGSVPLSLVALVHDGSDDGICRPAFVLHNESAHRIGGTHGVQPQPEHCAVCHWLQSLRTNSKVASYAPPSDDARQLAPNAALAPSNESSGRLSARAPPLA